MRKHILFITLFTCVLILLPFKDRGYSDNSNPALVSPDEGEEIELYTGEVKTIPVSNPTRIAIGKPNIVDVTSVTKREITLNPKAPGTTKLIVWDNFGEQDFSVRVLSGEMRSVKERADSLIKELNLPKIYTKTADSEEKVLLLGEVKSTQDKERVFTVLGSLKDKVVDLIKVKEEEAAVDIEVQILELDKDATNSLGFTWPGSITLTDSSGPTSTAVSGLRRVFHVSDFTRTAFNVTLSALVQEGKARILSRPRLTCQSGKEAELLVGGEKPIFTTSVAATSGAEGTEVEYKEYGIKLKIRPIVTEEKRIKLTLNVEVSEVQTAETIGTTSTGQTTAKAYPLTKRNASTELFLDDGQTMAIGGLIKQKNEEDLRKTPWLGDVPVLGMFFRKRETKIGGGEGERGNVELFIALTPTIVSKEMPQAKVAPVEKVTTLTAQKIEANPNILDYVRLVQAKIAKAIYYPQTAKDAAWEGTVKMSLNLSSNGQLKEATITQSSGYKILDDAAKEVANEQAPYPPFPPQIDAQELRVEVPIVYKKD